MRVKDLINELQLLDQDAEVIVKSSNFELNGSNVPLSFVHQYNEGSITTKEFRDAFDGGTYSKRVFEIYGGETTVVYIS